MHTARSEFGRTLGIILIAGAAAVLALPEAWAALCVWREPDRDIREIFGGGSYRTLLIRVGDRKAAIEQATGTRLDADETEFRFWPVIQGGKRVGTVSTHLGPGDFGAIEVVVAIVHPPGEPAKVREVRIQRDRERHRGHLRSAAFLDQFKGKTAASRLQVGDDIRPAHAQALRASRTVALSVKKLLVAYEQLGIANR